MEAGVTAPASSPFADPEASGEASAGLQLYQRHCAVCHGDQGDGKGTAAYLLSPVPRDFRSGRYRVVSGENGTPTRADLEGVIRRGMPGSSMPPWDHLSADEVEALVQVVWEFTLDGKSDQLLAYAADEDEELSREEAWEQAVELLDPGAELAVPEAAAPDAATLDAGRALYLQNCADCHGDDGRGQGVKEQWNEDGSPTRPRDFTAGIFKGEPDDASIMRRMLLGMPGSPMPSTEFEAADDSPALAAYVSSLVERGAENKVLQRRTAIRVARTTAATPTQADDPAWREAMPVFLPLMPLWWRDEHVEGVSVRALHDGATLAFLLTWVDAAADRDLLSQTAFSDAVAVQLSAAEDPPLFAMGATGEPVNIWLWKAAWEDDRERVRGVGDRFPHTPDDQYGHLEESHAGLYRTALASGNLQSLGGGGVAAEDLVAEGLGSAESQALGNQQVRARGAWKSGRWQVVLRRPMRTGSEGDVALPAGGTAAVAFAVWDGAAGDRDGQKSVTIWHELQLEP